MEIRPEDVCILIPTLNEAPTIGDLVREFRSMGFPHILVMDGSSYDGTPEIARREGAEVVTQSGKGKGNAIIQAFRLVRKPYVLMLDGDGTYSPEDAGAMLAPLAEGAVQVIGERFSRGYRAFTRLNLFGNRLLNYLFKVVHGKYLGDILSGYRAFRLDALREMQLRETGFEIEAEISSEAVRNGHAVAIVPVRYGERAGTATKLRPIRDGIRITKTIYRLAKTNNPIFYFGLIGFLVTLVGIVSGIYIVLEWFRGVDHIPLTILTVLMISLGFEIFMFGLIGDMVLSFHRELLHELQQLRRRPPN